MQDPQAQAGMPAASTSTAGSSIGAAQQEPFFRLRLINIDHVLTKPTPHDRAHSAFNPPDTELNRVPTIRVFGATPHGQRVCLHIHGVFPYCYVQYEGSLKPDNVLAYIARLGRALNACISASLQRAADRVQSSHIAAIHLVQGVPFYGYHLGPSYFLKISFVDPAHSYRIATILHSGKLLGRVFQPFEIHIRYLLQFMLDYNLYGCDFIDLESAAFRASVPEAVGDGSDAHLWTTETVSPEHIQTSLGKESFCTLEVDAKAAAILNRRLLKPRNLHYSLLEPPPSSSDAAQRLVPSLTELWEEEKTRRTKAGLPPSIPEPDTAGDERVYGRGEAPRWNAEARLRAALEIRLAKDEEFRSANNCNAKTFEGGNAYDRFILSAFESVELFHDRSLSQQERELAQMNPYTQTQAQAEPQHSQADSVSSRANSLLYDLEHSLSQQRANASQGAPLSSSGGNAQGSQRGAAASQGLLSDDFDLDNDIDIAFFATQAFRQALDRAEYEARTTEGDEPLMAKKKPDESNQQRNAQAPTTPSRKGAVSTMRTSPGGTPTSAQSSPRSGPVTPAKRPPSAQVTPRLNSRITTPSKPSPLKRMAQGAAESSDSRADKEDSLAESNASQLGDALRDLPAWQVRPDSQRSKESNEWRSHTRTKSASTTEGDASQRSQPNKRRRVEDTATRGGHAGTTTQRVTFQEESPVMQHDTSPVRPASSSPAAPVVTFSSPSLSVVSSAPSRPRQRQWQYADPAPLRAEVLNSFAYFNQPNAVHQEPWYSNPADVPKEAREYGGRKFKWGGKTIKYLNDFRPLPSADGKGKGKEKEKVWHVEVKAWTLGVPPPARRIVAEWAEREAELEAGVAVPTQKRKKAKAEVQSGLSKLTQAPGNGFKLSQRKPTVLIEKEKQHITILAMEVFVCTRGQLLPDPTKDVITAITYSFQNEDDTLEDTGSRPGLRTGVLVLDVEEKLPSAAKLGLGRIDMQVVTSEIELINALIDLVRNLDPEILVGWEIQNASWSYVVDRARKQFDFDLIPELGRVNSGSTGTSNDKWGSTQSSPLKVTGRHILNIWRLMRGDLALNGYSFENVVYHLLRRRTPKFTHETLTTWYQSGYPHLIARTLNYWIDRTEVDLEVIESSEQVFRTAEFARIYGVDFFSVISRGSQFKVESVMLRIAKPESFILPSPSQQQVGQQNAAEDLPLVMEPQSAFYKGPLLVLDFQSLYPSIMIAYNICYSTCLGRVSKFKETWKLGYTEHSPPDGLLSLLKDDVFVSPNGLLYVKPHVRRSLLAKMLTEILDTRVMVKGSTKGVKADKAFKRLQNARQLSLKLLANVTYGYTSATFSGRMPCVEVADSIVQYGRETLERAITLIHGRPEWGAQVVYGDTDSLFIYLDGRTKDEAFKIGHAMAEAVTADNPQPVKLKFEKVYFPSILMAKKRYVGFMYETQDQVEPVFNAKGIETVRRDGCPVLQRMLEAVIRQLFRTQDLSLIKSYCQRQWRKILEGRIPIQDFIISKEVRLGSYSVNGVPPPGAALAVRRMLADKRNEPQHAERVPYIISVGEPGAKQNDRAVSPEQMLENPSLRVDAQYYINNQLMEPLARVFNLMGTDVKEWYREMPKTIRASWSGRFADEEARGVESSPGSAAAGRLTLDDHYRSEHCLICGRKTEQDICPDCRSSPTRTISQVISTVQADEGRLQAMDRICATCSNLKNIEETPCVSIDCPVVYEKTKVKRQLGASTRLLKYVEVALEGDEAGAEEKEHFWGET